MAPDGRLRVLQQGLHCPGLRRRWRGAPLADETSGTCVTAGLAVVLGTHGLERDGGGASAAEAAAPSSTARAAHAPVVTGCLPMHSDGMIRTSSRRSSNA